MTMHLQDAIWGSVQLDEPGLEDLIGSGPVQRLRDIHQAGASFYLMPDTRAVTRFDHSVGVMLLLRGLGAPLEEQVAGLLHDVPHTAFSHTADTLFPSEEYDYHERFQRDVILASEIPDLLARHSVPLNAALEMHCFPLLERALPDLCADRIDYALRDMVALGETSPPEAKEFAGHLVITPVGLAVDNPDSAEWFATLFHRANDRIYTCLDDAGAYWALAGALRRSIDVGEFDQALLFTTDSRAMAALAASHDPLVQAYLALLKPGTRFFTVASEGQPFFTAKMKQRRIDPLVVLKGTEEAVRLSALSRDYARMLAGRPSSTTVEYRLWSRSIPPILQERVGTARK